MRANWKPAASFCWYQCFSSLIWNWLGSICTDFSHTENQIKLQATWGEEEQASKISVKHCVFSGGLIGGDPKG